MTSCSVYHEMRCKATRMASIIRTRHSRAFYNRYLKDGRYTIDNLAAERAIRPLTIERKKPNSSYGQ
jgi:hypothetical protein